MNSLFRSIVYMFLLTTFFCHYASAQVNLIPDSNLHRYTSFKYFFLPQTLDAVFAKPVNQENLKQKIDDYFLSNKYPVFAGKLPAQPPYLFVNVKPPINGGTLGSPINFIEIEFLFVDKLQGMTVIVWANDQRNLVFGNSPDKITNGYWSMLNSGLDLFGAAWSKSH